MSSEDDLNRMSPEDRRRALELWLAQSRERNKRWRELWWAEHEIPSSELQLEQVPDPDGPEGFGCFSQFAMTFNGYAWAERTLGRRPSVGALGKFAKSVRLNWLTNKNFPQTLSELRACLYFEQRRIHFAEGDEPEERTIAYCRDLVRAIREKVMRNERD